MGFLLPVFEYKLAFSDWRDSCIYYLKLHLLGWNAALGIGNIIQELGELSGGYLVGFSYSHTDD